MMIDVGGGKLVPEELLEREPKVRGLSPSPVPARLVSEGEWLQCGGCGWNGPVTEYIFVDKPWCFDAVCNCAIPATLVA